MDYILHLFETFISSFSLFQKGALVTIELTVVSIIVAVIVGLGLALLRRLGGKFLEKLIAAYVNLVRGTPLVVQIFVLYFGLTELIRLTPFFSASLALAFHTAAYISEIFRSAMNAIPKGQMEAAKSLGMSRALSYRKIILPQAWLRAIPGIGNQAIITLKDSSLAGLISMNEIFNVATTQGANHFDQMTFLLVGAVYYLVLVLILTWIVSKIEKKLSF